jgi:hypothetical protein
MARKFRPEEPQQEVWETSNRRPAPISGIIRQEGDTDPHRWRDVSRIFAAAAPLDRDARAGYLQDACGQDAALLNAVHSMLAAHDQAGSFGDQPVFAPEPARRLSPGSQIGVFRIDTLLGAGGMGEVYRARDTRLGRDVAIKVLPDTVSRDAGRRARFDQEARALAALNHPHIGAIYGVEERGDLAALVLELVEGPTLAERLARGHPPARRDRPDCAADRRGARSRARSRHRAPRSQARQHQGLG